MKKILIILCILLCLVGCDENSSNNEQTSNQEVVNESSETNQQEPNGDGSTVEEETPYIEATFLNASQKARGDFGTSSIELKKDGKFSLTDCAGMGATLIEGTYGRQEDVLMFTYDDSLFDKDGEAVLNFEFRYVDENTLELMRDLEGSLAGDCFSISGEIPSDFVAVFKKEDVLCTGLKAKYNYFWAIANPVNVYNLEVVATPENCTETISYTSDDESIAKVDQEGNVTPGNVGKTTIHVTCGNIKLDIPVESRPKVVDLEKIEMSDITIKVGEQATIEAKFYPDNATDKSLTYKSADSTRVTVDDKGTIVGVKPGPCDIYVSASNGETYTAHVMVEGEFLDIDLPLYSEVSYSQGNYAPCRVFVHGYKDGEEYTNDVWHEATLHSDGGEVEIVGDMLFAHSDPGKEIETNVWFTYNEMSTIKVTIYVQP